MHSNTQEAVEVKKNIVLCGVGGQGILTISKILVNAAMKEELNFKQAEVHGMSQRGGSVYAHLRLSDQPIYASIIPIGKADLVLSTEPLEALKQAKFLAAGGKFISSSSKLPNIEYDEKLILQEIERLNGKLVESKKIAIEAGNALMENIVLLGAASKAIGLSRKALKNSIREIFSSKGEKVIELNLKAFDLGLNA